MTVDEQGERTIRGASLDHAIGFIDHSGRRMAAVRQRVTQCRRARALLEVTFLIVRERWWLLPLGC